MTTTIRIHSDFIKSDICYCATACNDSSKRYALAGLRFEFDENGDCQIIATDGRRLHIAKIPKALFHTSTPNIQFTLNKEATDTLLKMSVKGTLQIDVDGADILTIHAPKGRRGKQIIKYEQTESPGRFPNWQQVMPDKKNEHGTITARIDELKDLINEVEEIPTFIDFNDNGYYYCKLKEEYTTRRQFNVEGLKGPLTLKLDYLRDAISTTNKYATCKIFEHVDDFEGNTKYKIEFANKIALIMGRN